MGRPKAKNPRVVRRVLLLRVPEDAALVQEATRRSCSVAQLMRELIFAAASARSCEFSESDGETRPAGQASPAE